MLADRAVRFSQVSELAELEGHGTRSVLGARRRVRWLGVVGTAALVVIGLVVGAWVASRIGLLMVDPGQSWLAGVFDRLAEWWDSLPGWAKALVFVGAAGGITFFMLATGGALLPALSTGLTYGGMGMYAAEHGGGIASLIRDPSGAVVDTTTSLARFSAPTYPPAGCRWESNGC